MTRKFQQDVARKVNEKLAALGFAPMDRSGMTDDANDDLAHGVMKARKAGIKSIEMSPTPNNMGVLK